MVLRIASMPNDISSRPSKGVRPVSVITSYSIHYTKLYEFARVEQSKRFQLLTKDLDHEDGELTATQKVKRSIVEDRFSDEIESMYR